MQDINIPISLTGVGSQPAEEDGAELDILQLPDEMTTFSMPSLPEREDVLGLEKGMDALGQIGGQLKEAVEFPAEFRKPVELTGLDETNRDLVDQVLGEGEVSVLVEQDAKVRIQESVMAGVWRVKYETAEGVVARDTVEIGDVPASINRAICRNVAPRVEMNHESIPEGVLNAPPLLAEINDKIAECRPGEPPHVINLTLLPQTEQDLEFLARRLGQGCVTILSRGYGNCRISSTATENVWWVQYFNSQDANILNTIEIGGVPAVACAALEDIRDSADRFEEIMEAYR